MQAALEILLSNGAGSSSPAPEQQQEARRRPQREAGHDRYYESDEEAPPARQAPRTAARPSPQAQRSVRERPPREGDASADSQQKLQEQADKLLAQASEVGINLFNRANAFWKEGKERAQRVYEERVAGAAAAGPSRQSPGDGARRNGKPKWMQDAEDECHVSPVVHDSGFKDDDDEISPLPKRPQAKQAQAPPRTREQPSAESPASRLKVGNLFSDDPPAVYVSPFRRKGPARAPAADAAASSAPATPVQKPSPSPARAPSPVALVQRRTVSASQAAITQSAQKKAAGTEKFKLGQYAEAESLYSAAISALPQSHLLLVPLYNNRALTRIKTGDHGGAIEDSTTVIELIGAAYHPAREEKITRVEDGAGVDLADGLVKAWWRRAEAYEGKEKWDSARQDWESIAGADFAGKVRTEAVRGIGRCRRMLKTDVETGVSSASAPVSRPSVGAAKPRVAPKPKPKPAARGPSPPSEAVNRLKEANEAQEAEEQARHDLKDAVEGRLGAWKAGKETNLRALIASLDTVLWPELGWQKVGIHELVSPSQVKIRYTKAIAKVHPDKVRGSGASASVLRRDLGLGRRRELGATHPFARAPCGEREREDGMADEIAFDAAQRAQHDGRAAHDCERRLRNPERGVERVQAVTRFLVNSVRDGRLRACSDGCMRRNIERVGDIGATPSVRRVELFGGCIEYIYPVSSPGLLAAHPAKRAAECTYTDREIFGQYK